MLNLRLHPFGANMEAYEKLGQEITLLELYAKNCSEAAAEAEFALNDYLAANALVDGGITGAAMICAAMMFRLVEAKMSDRACRCKILETLGWQQVNQTQVWRKNGDLWEDEAIDYEIRTHLIEWKALLK
jgi:hypothetical protein